MAGFGSWLKNYPMSAMMIVSCLVGTPYFGSKMAYEQYEAYKTQIVCSNILEDLTTEHVEATETENVVEHVTVEQPATETVAVQQSETTQSIAESETAETQQKENMTAAAWHFPAIATVNAQNTKKDKAERQKEQARKNGFTQVDESYFDDAVFIGDSRTDTLKLYSGWENATYYVKTGTNIWSIMDEEVALDQETGENISIDAALQKRQFGKVYIMLGVNELGVGSAETFYQQFKKVVARIQELQPNAIIFVESIIHVSAEKDAEGTVISNKEINVRNQWLQRLADKKTIFFIDANEVLDDESGALTSEYTFDGVHLKGDQLDLWKEFFFNHGIVR